MFLSTLFALSLTCTAPQLPPDVSAPCVEITDTIIDSRKTLQQALQGTTAPDSITRDLVLVDVEYYSFDNKLHRGQIVVHKELGNDMTEIFREIKRTRFPVQSVIPIQFDRPNNGTSMDTLNNTYGFHYRPVTTVKTVKLSAHSTGCAIDINPYHNPAILKNGTIIPKGGCYDPGREGTLTAQSPLVRLFRQYGWRWGGAWSSLKDYMHFEKPWKSDK